MAYIVQVRMAAAPDGRVLWCPTRRKPFRDIEKALEYQEWLIRTFLRRRRRLSRVIETKDNREAPEKWDIIR